MPFDSRPRSFARLMTIPPGNSAPTRATATLRPARTLGAPQTICRRLVPSIVTWHSDNFSAFGWRPHSSTSPTTTPENGAAAGTTASTSSPASVSCEASSAGVAVSCTNSPIQR